MSQRIQIDELLQRERKFKAIVNTNANYFLSVEGKTTLDEWINDVDIYSHKYLVSHPLYKRIQEIIAHREKDTISSLVACLRSIKKDNEFWLEHGVSDSLKEYEELLSVLLSKVDCSDPLVLSYPLAPFGIETFKKLQNEGLIEKLKSVGRNHVSFIITYEGIHYFDENQRGKQVEHSAIEPFVEYDLFLSHANKDKIDYVDELKKSLDRLGISIFYDKDTLKWGDHWKEKILEGVQKTEFAIIVISENFFGREWTERELYELLARQNSDGQRIILPILHNVTMSQLEEKYPEIAEIQYISSQGQSTDEIALMFAERLIKRIRSYVR